MKKSFYLQAFLMFDFDHDGVIGKNDLITTLMTMGKDEVTDEEVEAMLAEVRNCHRFTFH